MYPKNWRRYYWFWHLLYDNPIFGHRLHEALCRFKTHRNLDSHLAPIGYGFYGLEYYWRCEQRRSRWIHIPKDFGKSSCNEEVRFATEAESREAQNDLSREISWLEDLAKVDSAR